MPVGLTNSIKQNSATIVADHLEELLNLLQEPGMVDWLGQFNVTKMTGTLVHALIARSTLELTVDRSQARVIESLISWLQLCVIHSLRVYYVSDTHVLDLLRREQPKLNLLYGTERRIGALEVKVRHAEKLSWNVEVNTVAIARREIRDSRAARAAKQVRRAK